MKMFFYLFPYFILGYIVWLLVLKKSAYADSVPKRFKWMHAAILYYVMLNGWFALDGVGWLFRHASQVRECLASQPNALGPSSIGIMMLITSLAGPPLLLVCHKMGRRRHAALRWFFVLWPITFFSSNYVAIVHARGIYPSSSALFAACMSTGMFLISILFYANGSVTKALFESTDLTSQFEAK